MGINQQHAGNQPPLWNLQIQQEKAKSQHWLDWKWWCTSDQEAIWKWWQMLGKMDGEMMIFVDCFALPVEGAETWVNAQAAACEYMAKYVETTKQVGCLGKAIGWFHGPLLLWRLAFWDPCQYSDAQSAVSRAIPNSGYRPNKNRICKESESWSL